MKKKQIIANLTAMEEKYDIAIAKNTSLTDSLTNEKAKIVALKDSVYECFTGQCRRFKEV